MPTRMPPPRSRPPFVTTQTSVRCESRGDLADFKFERTAWLFAWDDIPNGACRIPGFLRRMPDSPGGGSGN